MPMLMKHLQLTALLVIFASWVGCQDEPTLLKPCEWGKIEQCSCPGGESRGTRMCSKSGSFGSCDCSDDEPDAGGVEPIPDASEPRPSGCIMVEPEAVDFGAVSVLGTATRPVSVLNCSFLTPLTLASIETCTADSPEGECEPSAEFGATTQSGIEMITIPPLTTATVNVTFTPPDLQSYTGRLDVLGVGGATGSVDLVGEGDSCPQPVAEARVVDSTAWQAALSTIPLATVEFTAMSSVVPGGVAPMVEWALVQRPANSTTTLLPSSDAAEPTLFLDLAGYYIVELTVLDAATGEGCGEPARVSISALPDQDIHIQMVWDTPTDANQTDNDGTDVDLHFRHPLGTWDVAPYDIYWANRTADWGVAGDDADDPSLDIDDVTGAGPENINMGGAEDGAIYQIGAYYFAANGYGVSNVSVRIYIRGVQQFEQLAVPLTGTGEFWLVASLEAPAMTITDANEVITGFPAP